MSTEILEAAQQQFVHPELVILPFSQSKEFYVERLDEIPKKLPYRVLKRLFDMIAAVLGLLVCAVPMALIAAAIKYTSSGTVFYRQQRLGKNGTPFNIIKFRTMRMDAEADGARWSEGENDSRITPIGAWLRKYRLDELPQFFNVITGTMSIVGPRPERPCFYEAFETYIHGFSQRLMVKPGITGLAQVNGGYNLRPEEKICYDMEYIKKRSLWMDFKILLRTIGVVLNHQDAK